MRRAFSLLSLVLSLVAFTACKSPPPEDPDAVDWSSYERAHDSPPAAAAAPPPSPAPPVAPPPSRPAHRKPPREIRVIQNQAPPFGYTEITTPNWNLFAVGLGVAVATYVPPALIASGLGGNAWTMQVPVAGPILQMVGMVEAFSANGCCNLVQAGAVYMSFVGLAVLFAGQAGGLTLAAIGLFEKQKHWVRSEYVLLNTPSFGMNLQVHGSTLELKGRF